jgi:ADP-ribose pyrophosphatase YjhB (NUDIX family)
MNEDGFQISNLKFEISSSITFIIPHSSFLLSLRHMLKRLVAAVWLGAPRFVRRAGVWLSQPRFTVTAGAVVRDEAGRVLLLRHALRKGSGWGIPGGFLVRGEQPEEAVRREVREETGLALERVELAFVRTLEHVNQVEVIFRAEMAASALEGLRKNFEIERAQWFALDALPADVGRDQRQIIARALGAAGGANSRE